MGGRVEPQLVASVNFCPPVILIALFRVLDREMDKAVIRRPAPD